MEWKNTCKYLPVNMKMKKKKHFSLLIRMTDRPTLKYQCQWARKEDGNLIFDKEPEPHIEGENHLQIVH